MCNYLICYLKLNSLLACQRFALINLPVVEKNEQIINILQEFMLCSVGNLWLGFVVVLKYRSNYYTFPRKEKNLFFSLLHS